jgi:hypothetical protein
LEAGPVIQIDSVHINAGFFQDHFLIGFASEHTLDPGPLFNGESGNDFAEHLIVVSHVLILSGRELLMDTVSGPHAALGDSNCAFADTHGGLLSLDVEAGEVVGRVRCC